MIKFNLRRGFTLTETMVAVAIFVSLITIGSSVLVVNYVAGRPTSAQKEKINSDMSRISETIRQKMQNANTVSDTSPIIIKGFNTTNNILAIAATSGEGKRCNFIGFKNNAIWMLNAQDVKEEKCQRLHLTVDNEFEQISSPDIKITGFQFSNVVLPASYASLTSIPQFTLTITARDKANIVKTPMILRDTYYLSYETIKGF